MKAPLCKDCKHRIEQIGVLPGTNYRCGRRPDAVRKTARDPVTGASYYTVRAGACGAERISDAGNRCGPEGKFFEAGARRAVVNFFGQVSEVAR